MKNMLISILFTVAKKLVEKYVTPGLFDEIYNLVFSLLDDEMPGSDKRSMVEEAIKGTAGWEEIKTTVIDTVIQVVLIKLKGV